MFKLAHSRLGVLVAVWVSIILSLAMLSFAFISTRLVDDFGKTATMLNEASIQNQTERLLLRCTYTQAERYSAIFQKAASLTALVAAQAGSVFDRMADYAIANINPDERLKRFPNGVYSNAASEALNVVCVLGRPIQRPIQNEINALSHIDPLLISAQKRDIMYTSAWVMTESGISRYYPNTHFVGNLPPIDAFDYLGDHRYAIAIPRHNPKRLTKWTQIYEDITGKGLMTTVSTPVYDADDKFRGVVGIDITLDALLDTMLGRGRSSDPERQYTNEFSFLVDATGDLISMPSDRLKMFGLNAFDPKSIESGQLLSLNLNQSNSPEIKALTAAMIDSRAGIQEVRLDGRPYIIAFHQMPATGWSLGVAIPEYDLLASIRSTRNTLNATVSRMSTRFVWLALFFLLIAIGGTCYFFNRRLLQPIQQLIGFTRAVSQGRGNARVEITQKDEIGDLAAAFNQMAHDLRKTTVSRDALSREVNERTQAQQALARRAAFERLISEISSNFVGLSLDEIDPGIDGALASIGSFTQADRAYVFQFKAAGSSMANTHEWCAAGIQPQIQELQDITLEKDLPWLAERIWTRDVLEIADVAALPAEAEIEKMHFQAQDIQSLILVSMMLEERFIGFLGFDAVCERRAWTAEDKTALRLVSETFANAIGRQRVDDSLRQSESKLRAILDAAPDPIVVYDNHGYPLFLNPAFTQLFGWTLDELAGSTVPFVPDDQMEITSVKIGEIYQTGDIVGFETRRLTRTGKSVAVNISAAPILNGATSVSGMVVCLTDLRKIKKLEEQVRQAQKMEVIGTLAGGIAHEFNNMLSVIVGNAELAIDDISPGHSVAGNLNEIMTASWRAKDVVKKLLSAARKAPSSQKPVAINAIVAEALALLRKTIPTTIDIQQHLLCRAETILADPTEITQVVMNLCINAAHAMTEKPGILTVGLEAMTLTDQADDRFAGLAAGNYVKLTVADTGKGIDADIIGRIFDPYFTTKEVDEGLGMGLAVVQGIVKKHNGAIAIQSDVGQGATATVLFPLIAAPAQIAMPAAAASGNQRLLFVDDEASIVKMAKIMLTGAGYAVTGTTDPLDALNMFTANPQRFDLVLTDMAMPHMPGDRLAREIIRIRADIPIILCTGHSDHMDEHKAQELGIKALVMKPASKAELIQTIRNVMAGVG